jgi:hypothetical protein
MKNVLLDSNQLIGTVDRLCLRIEDRFPDSGLYHAGRRLHSVGKETDDIVSWIEKPNLLYRILIGGFIVIAMAGLIYAISNVRIDFGNFSLSDLVQSTEAALNDIILLGAAVVFLVSIETRTKRKKIIQAINTLRSIAHIIDAHQLTKDPDAVLGNERDTVHSPKRSLTPYQLGRYLDYCSEMLSLTSKIGFLYVQRFNDPVSQNAVNELENLATGLSRKIWQKIMIIRGEGRKD